MTLKHDVMHSATMGISDWSGYISLGATISSLFKPGLVVVIRCCQAVDFTSVTDLTSVSI